MSLLVGAASNAGGGYNLENSLRFRSSASAYLERTPATASNRRTWTWSAWVKVNATQTDGFCLWRWSNYRCTELILDSFNGIMQNLIFYRQYIRGS
jgi:hypothetical protein